MYLYFFPGISDITGRRAIAKRRNPPRRLHKYSGGTSGHAASGLRPAGCVSAEQREDVCGRKSIPGNAAGRQAMRGSIFRRFRIRRCFA
ncbi:hypothetical protein ASZ90_010356 [hydrocarbon metagenome]|uniref:Uncharacterized protein n=1 Tax=hydrocarbon metagenome TaxID=938273 RepID=A0A0W8FGA2_9ZZZZ